MTGSHTSNDNRRPVVVVTGFLGSGKTTLVNRLLQSSGMADTAVIVNEFGEIALDHLIVERAIENTVVLSSGCVCCAVRGDLVDTILDLGRKVTRGDIPSFSRILIETTGLADPGPIVQTFASEPLLRETCRLTGIVTTIDCLNGQDQLARFAEPARQVALADVILLTKSDIATPRQVAVLDAEIRGLNPTAQISVVVDGNIAPGSIFSGFTGGDSENEHVVRWLSRMASSQGVGVGVQNEYAGEPAPHDEHAAAHTHGITAACLVFEQPIPWPALRSWLGSLISLRGSDVLRIKGIVDVDGQGPVIVQAVHHLVHPPVRMVAWPDDDRRTRLVIIGMKLSTKGLKASLEMLIASHHDQSPPPVLV